jgi:4-hydroxy-3-methylbut-2-enyl diphosphate reductase
MQVILAQPRGFCAGVKRAIEIVSRAIEVYGAPLYVRHEIVHNRTVVEELKSKGAVFVDDLADVPDGATLIFSAHGVPRSVCEAAHARPLRIFDATCPLVTKVHRQVVKLHDNGKKIVMIGHASHPEVEGTMGQIDEGIYLVESVKAVNELDLETSASDLSYVTQTTISVDDAAEVIWALKKRFPAITEPKKNDVCYATQNRQDAVKRLAAACDLVLVVGSVTSSNSNRLREVAERHGCTAKLIDTAADMRSEWFEGVATIGITAGASAPDFLVQEVVSRLKDAYPALSVTTQEGDEENVAFPLPKGLWDTDLAAARAAKDAQ